MTYPQPPLNDPGSQSAAKPRLRGRIPLRLSLIFAVVGIVLIVVGSVVGVKHASDAAKNFPRVSIATGTGTVKFGSAGNYVAYYEASNVSDKTLLPTVAVRLTSPSGSKMILDTLYGGKKLADANGKDDLDTTVTYDVNGHHGIAYYQFHISQAGTYGVELQTVSTTTPPPGATMAFGKSIGKSIALAVGLILPGVLLLIAAIVLLIVGLVRRRGHKKQLASAGSYGGPPPGYGGPPPGYGGPPPGYGGPQGGYGGPPPGYGYPQGGYNGPQGGYPQGPPPDPQG